jgi:hypothetical protein
MDSAFAIVLIVGYLISIVGGFMVIFAAFRESALWGLACLFIPFASLVFLIKFWDAGKRGFFVSLAGLGVCVIAGVGLFMTVESSAPETESPMASATVPVEASAWNEPEPQPRSSAWNDTPQVMPVAATIDTSRPQQTSMLLAPPADAPRVQPNVRSQPRGFVTSRVVEPTSAVEKVWADRATRLYYSEGCGTRPAAAFRIAKSVAVVQGFQPAPCV